MSAYFDLKLVHAAARNMRWEFRRRAEQQRRNLEYSDEEVVEVLLSLQPQHFDKTHREEWGTLDAYTISWRHYVPSQERHVVDDLYVKFCYYEHEPMLIVSFHR